MPSWAVNEFRSILLQNENDTVFSIKREPGSGCEGSGCLNSVSQISKYHAETVDRKSAGGIAICSEAACKGKEIPLIANEKGTPMLPCHIVTEAATD